MIETSTSIFFRQVCDKCGRGSDFRATIQAANERAREQGYIFSDWLLNTECPRQTVFCHGCIDQMIMDLQNKEVKQQ